MRKNYYLIIFSLLILGFLVKPGLTAEGDPPEFEVQPDFSMIDDESNDAIAVRILPNPRHYSIERWYKSQGFTGSPQSLLVDGYEAVRDGRTIYVNAANLDLKSKKIYTNIYLISYNQGPDRKTVDVLGQIVKNWQFNTNLNNLGKCNISTELCNSDLDCRANFFCNKELEDAPGRCLPDQEINCYADLDCPSNLFCDSFKAKLTRDVKRLGIMSDLKESLASYQIEHSRYPNLSTGTYLKSNSISTWPSWQANFLSTLKAKNLLDPINSLGPCPGFDPISCWDEGSKTYSSYDNFKGGLSLPEQSHAFIYSSNELGSSYNLCANMELSGSGYDTDSGVLADLACSNQGSFGGSDNMSPYLASYSLNGQEGKEFIGYIKVIDPDGDPLSWTMTSQGDWSSWSKPLSLEDTSNPNQKRLWAQKAGSPGEYNIQISVSDNRGAILRESLKVLIDNKAPFIQVNDIYYTPSLSNPLTLRFSINDSDFADNPNLNYQSIFSISSLNIGDPGPLRGGSMTYQHSGDTIYYTIEYPMESANYDKDTEYIYTINTQDAHGNSASKQFKLTIKVDPPALNINCPNSVRLAHEYYCYLGPAVQGEYLLEYEAEDLPEELKLEKVFPPEAEEPTIDPPSSAKFRFFRNSLSWLQSLLLSAKADSVPGFGKDDELEKNKDAYYTLSGVFNEVRAENLVKIKLSHQFGAYTSREFNISANDYCGDGIKQTPNLEARGGYYNDGYEECDGNAGILTDKNQISMTMGIDGQYACSTKPKAETNNPILDGQLECSYLASDKGGGYCGDGYCQARITHYTETGEPYVINGWENKTNCSADCLHDLAPIN